MVGDDFTGDAMRHGTESNSQTAAIRTLTRVAFLLFIAWMLWFFQVLVNTTQVAGGPSAGVWEQRTETIAFIGFINNLPALALPAVAASVATWLAGPTQSLELAVLLRSIRWIANVLVAIAVLSVVFTIFGKSGGLDQVDTIAVRSSGAVAAAGLSLLCRDAGRRAPGG